MRFVNFSPDNNLGDGADLAVAITCVMPDATSLGRGNEQVERDIAEAERLISERVRSIIAALQRGENTSEAETRVREMRGALELLYNARRRGAAHVAI
jgi:hypothetical protein